MPAAPLAAAGASGVSVCIVVPVMAIEGPPIVVHDNYVATSQPGCHIAHHDADWIIEASDFDPEDFGIAPEEEEQVPDMIIDPETRSLRCLLLAVCRRLYDSPQQLEKR